MVITSSQVTLKEISKIKFLNYIRVYWERKNNDKKIIQCKNCQQWGHAASNCFGVPNCLKCGAEHATADCRVGEEIPPKCANCNGPHIASSIECPVYQFRLSKLRRPAVGSSQLQHSQPKNKKESSSSINLNRKTYTYQSNFPALSRKEGSSEHKTDNLNVQWPNHTNRDKPSTSSAFEIQHLAAEIARTNQLINLRGLLQAVRDYNEILVKCTSPESKFQASLEFFSCIGKYDL